MIESINKINEEQNTLCPQLAELCGPKHGLRYLEAMRRKMRSDVANDNTIAIPPFDENVLSSICGSIRDEKAE